MAEQTNQKAVTSNSREKGTVSSRFVTMEHSFFMPPLWHSPGAVSSPPVGSLCHFGETFRRYAATGD